MNERTLTAIRACEKAAAAIAKRHGWDEPHFYLPHSDYEIEYWRAAEALSTFLAKVAGVDKASAQAATAKVKAAGVLSVPLEQDEREEKASELVTSYVFPYLTETVVNATTAVTLTGETSGYINDKPAANFAEVVGIGKENQVALHNAGYFTWEDILQAGILKIREDVPAISASRVRALFTRAEREAE